MDGNSVNRTASEMLGNSARATFPIEQFNGFQSGLTNFNSLGSYTYTYPYYQYWYYPYSSHPPKADVAETIRIFKKEFGKDWKKYFAATVRIEAK